MNFPKVLRWLFLFIIISLAAVKTFEIQQKKAYQFNGTVLSPVVNSKSIFAFFLPQKHKPKKIIFGYLPYWTLDKLKYLQLDKLTDIAYFGLYINADGTFRTKLEDGTTEPGYNHWANDKDLKDFIAFAQKSKVRVSLTIISHDDEISDKFLGCRECWDTLLANIKKELDFHQIKDINLNFEYVEFTEADMAKRYTELTQFLNIELDKTYENSFLTVATFADSFVKPRVTNVGDLAKIADGLFVMAYDFHQPNSDNAGPVAPIDGIGTKSEYDINTMVNDYLRVAPPNKVILGVPYYGYNWVVEGEESQSERIPGNDMIGYSGSQAYSDIMDKIIEIKPDLQWDEVAQTPFFTYISDDTGSTRQVYFENAESLKAKYEVVSKMNLAGVGIWALGYDGGYQELWDLLEEEFLD